MFEQEHNPEDEFLNKVFETATGVSSEPKPVNPFLAGMKVKAKKQVGGILAVERLTDEDGQTVGTELRSRKYVDEQQFIKIMSKCFGVAFDMKQSGQKMLWFVFQETSRSVEKDLIRLTFSEKARIGGREVKVSRTTFYEGLRELKKTGFIASYGSKTGLYWINPEYFFNGNRLRFVQDFNKKNSNLGKDHKPTVEFPSEIEEYKPTILRRSLDND